MEWWQLKAAKDFETGIGQTLFRGGTLSTWTDEQIAALQKEMQNTLDMAGYHDKDTQVSLKTPKAQILPGKKVSASNLDDFAAEIKKQQDKQNTKEEEDRDPLYDFDDEIIHSGNSDDEDDDGKQSKYGGDSMMGFDPSQLKELTSMDQLAGKFDANIHGKGDKASHRRTRTEALRYKLQNMQKQLENVTNLSNKQTSKLEEQKQNEQQRERELAAKLSGMQGALQSANNELDLAEEQIIEKDEEIANLKRELAISKQMNTELAQTALANANGDKENAKDIGLTMDDLLKQRIKDANRFAFMLSAMQEQLDFERKQFVHKIHNLELQLEHKDVQLNALYQLYNKLVSQTKSTSSSWWDRFSMSKK